VEPPFWQRKSGAVLVNWSFVAINFDGSIFVVIFSIAGITFTAIIRTPVPGLAARTLGASKILKPAGVTAV
jgi:hypothetical protein